MNTADKYRKKQQKERYIAKSKVFSYGDIVRNSFIFLVVASLFYVGHALAAQVSPEVATVSWAARHLETLIESLTLAVGAIFIGFSLYYFIRYCQRSAPVLLRRGIKCLLFGAGIIVVALFCMPALFVNTG